MDKGTLARIMRTIREENPVEERPVEDDSLWERIGWLILTIVVCLGAVGYFLLILLSGSYLYGNLF